MNSDLKELLKIFGQEKVKYLIVGGYAVAKHAAPRPTEDLDIWVGNKRKNVKRAFGALKKFGAPLAEFTVEDFTVPMFVYRINAEPTRVEILMGVKRLDFDECWERRASAKIGGTDVYFISIDDLIFHKQLAGRPKDLRDVENLKLKKKESAITEKTLPERDE